SMIVVSPVELLCVRSQDAWHFLAAIPYGSIANNKDKAHARKRSGRVIGSQYPGASGSGDGGKIARQAPDMRLGQPGKGQRLDLLGRHAEHVGGLYRIIRQMVGQGLHQKGVGGSAATDVHFTTR